jgi:cell wall-associated NlpC family hydrolase
LPVRNSLRALALAALGAVAVFATGTPAPAAAATPTASTTAAQRVIAIAASELGKPWRYAATGPNAFDCSGLVLYAFQHAGVGNRIGGGHSALGMWRWFAARGLASRSAPQVGDLVIYNGGAHVGIYIGNGRVISTLVSGVRITGVYALRGRFTAFLHTGLSGTPARTTSAASQPKAAAAPRVTSWRTTTTALRLRTGASTRYAIAAVLRAGTKVAVIASTRVAGVTWYRVRVGARVGWVAGSYTRAA